MLKYFTLLLSSLWMTINVYAQNVGVGTATPTAAFNVAQGKTVLFGSDTSGGGGKLMWIPSKYAFRAGGVGPMTFNNSNYNEDPLAWNADSIGMYSFAGGYENKVTGIGSTGFGGINTIRGAFSLAVGFRNQVNGMHSFAQGASNECNSGLAMAFGNNNTVSSPTGCAIGYNNRLSGDFNAFAAGYSNICSEYNSMAIGNNNHSTNRYSIAIGSYHDVKSVYGTSLGYNTNNTSNRCTIVGSRNDTLPEWSPEIWKWTDPIFIVGNGLANSTPSNAMVILKNGRVGLGTNTPDGLIHGVYDSSPGVPQLLLEESTTDYARITMRNTNPGFWDIAGYCHPLFGDNSSGQLNFYYGNFGNVLSLKGNGNATLAGVLTQNSDIRLKKNIEPISDALARVLKINGYTYNWKDTLRGSDLQIGFIAQQLEQEFPELVATDENGMKSVAYSNMIPVLLEAIKEQQKQIEELKALVMEK